MQTMTTPSLLKCVKDTNNTSQSLVDGDVGFCIMNDYGHLKISIENVNTPLSVSLTESTNNEFVMKNLYDPTSSIELNKDYSSSSVDTKYVTTSNTVITKINISMQTTSVASLVTGFLLGAGLTNGLKFYYKKTSDGSKVYLHPDLVIKTNNNLFTNGFELLIDNDDGSSNYSMVVSKNINMHKYSGLFINNGGEIGCELNDDFSSSTSFYIVVEGYKIQ